MVQIENLSFRYGRRSGLFEGLNLSMDSGHIYGLLGRNGAGKTTLLKIMMGMLFPKAGTCQVLGYMSKLRKPAMLSDMLYVPEEFYAPAVSIQRYINLYAPFYPAFDITRFEACLSELQLNKNDHFQSLSLGQKKKVVLGFALAANTRVLLLDEPTNGLDIPSKTQFRRMVAAAADDDRCIIISTHQVRDIDKLIDIVVILDNNQILLNQSVGNITERLSFGITGELTGQELYAEESIAGYQTVTPTAADEATQINLELLFNAAISNQQTFKHMFNS
ncbi:MAG: ABC transporter ATP-binding protein [Tannerella sp.]|jgi:ABC-2 type transport system ATP-binding protein|nr:ABC transporter ATP-binding protein [Tannerella sp.]